jgi:hypothetical protein
MNEKKGTTCCGQQKNPQDAGEEIRDLLTRFGQTPYETDHYDSGSFTCQRKGGHHGSGQSDS